MAEVKPEIKVPEPTVIEENGTNEFFQQIWDILLQLVFCFFFVDDDFEDDAPEPEPEPEHSSLANMLNNGDEDDYYGYDEEY